MKLERRGRKREGDDTNVGVGREWRRGTFTKYLKTEHSNGSREATLGLRGRSRM